MTLKLAKRIFFTDTFFYVHSPEQGVSVSGYCDIQPNDSPQCLEMDIIEVRTGESKQRTEHQHAHHLLRFVLAEQRELLHGDHVARVPEQQPVRPTFHLCCRRRHGQLHVPTTP